MKWFAKSSLFLASLALLTALSVSVRANAQVNSLFDAASRGDLPRVRALLDASADVNAKDSHGATALMWASQEGNADVVRALLGAKANVNAKTRDGITALYLASGLGHADVVRALIDAGSDVNIKAGNGTSALIVASESGYKDIVKALLAAKADIDAKDDDGETALRLSLRNGHDDVVELLRKSSGIDIASIKLITWEQFGAYLASQAEINALEGSRTAGMTFSGYTGQGNTIISKSLFVGVGATDPSGKPIGISVFTLGRYLPRTNSWVADMSQPKQQIYQYIGDESIPLIRVGSEISVPQNEFVAFAGKRLRGGKIIVRTEGLEIQPGTEIAPQ